MILYFVPYVIICIQFLFFIINLFIRIFIFLDTKDLQNNIEPEVKQGPKLGINKNILRHLNNIIEIFRKYFSRNLQFYLQIL